MEVYIKLIGEENIVLLGKLGLIWWAVIFMIEYAIKKLKGGEVKCQD